MTTLSAPRRLAPTIGEVASAVSELKLAERWSLFNPKVTRAYFRVLRQLATLAHYQSAAAGHWN